MHACFTGAPEEKSTIEGLVHSGDCDRDRRRFGQRAFLHRILAFARMWSIVPGGPDKLAG